MDNLEEQIKSLPEYQESNMKHGCKPLKIVPCSDGGLRWNHGILQQPYYVELFYKCGYMQNTERFNVWLDVPKVEE